MLQGCPKNTRKIKSFVSFRFPALSGKAVASLTLTSLLLSPKASDIF